jgi:PhnB protein
MAVSPIPAGYEKVTPYLIMRGAAKAIDFYQRAFGATEIMRFNGPGDTIGHAEIRIDKSIIMLADGGDEHADPQKLGGTPVSLMLYVPDVDAAFNRAIAAGAKVTRPVANQFYGDRTGILTDPFGHVWCLATHVEDVSVEEMQRRMQKMMSETAKA